MQLFCPLVDFNGTFDRHSRDRIKFLLQRWWNQERFEQLEKLIPGSNQGQFLETILDFVRARSQSSRLFDISELKWPQGWQGLSTLGTSDFLMSAQNFTPFIDSIAVPTLIWATTRDPMVPYDLNAVFFENSKNKSIQMQKLSHGIHCGLYGAYDLRGMGGVARQFFEINSELKRTMQRFSQPLRSPARFFLDGNDAKNDKPQFLQFRVEILGSVVRFASSVAGSSYQFDDLKLGPGLDRLTTFEAEMVTRYFTANSRMYVLADQIVLETVD